MPITPDLPKAEIAIVEMSNAFRNQSAVAAVRSDPLLAKAARAYAGFLAASTIFSHEADGRRPVDRIKAAGYEPCSTAENLAWMSDTRGFETRDLATRMVEGWKASPPHRKNLMLPNVIETGVAIAKVRGEEKYMAVQLLGRPARLQYTFEIENTSGRTIGYSLLDKALTLETNKLVRHTVCEPAAVTFELKPAGLLSKADRIRHDLEPGKVFRLKRGSAGAAVLEIGRSP